MENYRHYVCYLTSRLALPLWSSFLLLQPPHLIQRMEGLQSLCHAKDRSLEQAIPLAGCGGWEEFKFVVSKDSSLYSAVLDTSPSQAHLGHRLFSLFCFDSSRQNFSWLFWTSFCMRLTSNSQTVTCLCPLSAGIKGMCHDS